MILKTIYNNNFYIFPHYRQCRWPCNLENNERVRSHGLTKELIQITNFVFQILSKHSDPLLNLTQNAFLPQNANNMLQKCEYINSIGKWKTYYNHRFKKCNAVPCKTIYFKMDVLRVTNPQILSVHVCDWTYGCPHAYQMSALIDPLTLHIEFYFHIILFPDFQPRLNIPDYATIVDLFDVFKALILFLMFHTPEKNFFNCRDQFTLFLDHYLEE